MITPLRFGLLLMTFLGFSGIVKAQAPLPDRTAKWEVGIETVRVDFNSKHYTRGRSINLVQPLPGFYVRRLMGRTAFRIGLQLGRLYYGDKEYECITCAYTRMRASSVGFYSGVSYQPFKKAGWLQLIADFSFQNLHGWVGSAMVDTDPPTKSTDFFENDFFLRVGLNPRIPLSKRLSIGMELTVGRGYRYKNFQWIDLQQGQVFNRSFTFDSKFQPMGNLMIATRF